MKLDLLVAAIAREEGAAIAGSIPQRLNNPGDLMFAHQAQASPHPVIGVDGKTRVYAAFPTLAAGSAALIAQIELDASRGETLEMFIKRYAPASDGNRPTEYLRYVMTQIGETDASRKLADVIADV